jgi:16S rRNA (guanine966-N2)-methyltransferase
MRVIAGEFRSRVLQAPKGEATRPTSDKLRGTLFNVLGLRVEGARFVDLYAGSGAVGIEAISRGADFCWFAEKAPAALAAIKANLQMLKISGGYAVENRGAKRLLEELLAKETAVEMVFLDPPYEEAEAYRETLAMLGRHHRALLADGALVVAEHAKRQGLELRYGVLERYRVLEQGDAALSFYSVPG